MTEEKTSLSPRETAMRMLLHVDDHVSYEDIIRQLRILQQIDRTLCDENGVSWLEEVTPEPTSEPYTYESAGASSSGRKLEDVHSAASSKYSGNDPFGIQAGAPVRPAPFEMENADYAPYPSGLPSLVLRSRPLYSWRSLAERSDDHADSFFDSATWIY